MSRRVNAYAASIACVAAAALSLPSVGWADSGGTGLSGGSQPSSHAGGPDGTVQPGTGSVSATGNGMTIRTHVSAFVSHQMRFTGSVPSSDAGKVVEIQRKGRQTGWTWTNTAHATIRPDGTFAVVWPANHIGRFAFHAVILNGTNSHAAAASPSVKATVYRSAIATIYGPGFWGHRTACGQVLTHRTLGVANRTLPCGTRVSIYYQGKTIVVPVIDRGPYANNADWDLTQATSNALHMYTTATIWAVSLPPRGS